MFLQGIGNLSDLLYLQDSNFLLDKLLLEKMLLLSSNNQQDMLDNLNLQLSFQSCSRMYPLDMVLVQLIEQDSKNH
jgi:hypothetical protein